jgi:hypothetical protein
MGVEIQLFEVGALSYVLIIFRKSAQKIQVPLESDKKNGYFTWTPMYVHDNI